MRKHWLKRTIAYVLTLCMMASLLVGLPPMEVKAATSGDLGNGITWSLNGDTLTITGNGAIPDYQEVIGELMPWKDCSAQIKNVIIGEGITRIGNNSFFTDDVNPHKFTNLQSINLPQSLTSIGQCAFSGCTGITKVSFPEKLTSIGDSAFSGCTGITEVTLPENLTSMGTWAFEGCRSIQTVIFPKKLTSISRGAFQNCTGIKTVTFPEELTSIDKRAFYNCTSIETVALPNSLTSIGEEAFGGCGSLREVICKPTTPPTYGLFAFYPTYFYTNKLKGIKVPKGKDDAIYNLYCSQWSDWKDFIEGVNFHTHNWVYAASGNVISAYCNSEEGKEDCTANGVTNAKTLTLSAPSDLTYNGQPKTAHATDDLSVLTGTSLGKINYEGVSPTVYEKSETAPTNVGTYKATLTLTVDANTSYTAEQEFEIEKADATATVAAKNGLTYNGKDQELVTSTINGCTGYYCIGETGAWSTTVPKAKGA